MRKVAGWIADYSTGSFHWPNPSCRNMTVSSIQPLTEMSTKNIPWEGRGGGKTCWLLGLMKFLHSFTDNFEMWETENPGTLRACPAM